MYYQITVGYDGRIEEQWIYDTADKENLEYAIRKRKLLRRDSRGLDITTQRISAEQFQRLLKANNGRRLLICGVD